MTDFKDDKPSLEDVSPANKKVTPPTSKHIIVSGSTGTKDTTLADESKPEKPEAAQSLSHKVVISPISSDVKDEQVVEVKKVENTSVTPDTEPQEEAVQVNTDNQKNEAVTDTESKPETPEPDSSDSKEPTEEKANIEQLINQKSSDKQVLEVNQEAKTAKADEQKTALSQKYEELAQSKKYYLPINSQAKKRTKKFLIINVIIIFILLICWFDIALDAGIIKVAGIHSVTHFFK